MHYHCRPAHFRGWFAGTRPPCVRALSQLVRPKPSNDRGVRGRLNVAERAPLHKQETKHLQGGVTPAFEITVDDDDQDENAVVFVTIGRPTGSAQRRSGKRTMNTATGRAGTSDEGDDEMLKSGVLKKLRPNGPQLWQVRLDETLRSCACPIEGAVPCILGQFV